MNGQLFAVLLLATALAWSTSMEANAGTPNTPTKTRSVFCSPERVERAKTNASTHDWAKTMEQEIVERAAPWLAMPDDELWGLMFGPNIPRTWMVWSDGYCPACKEAVRMYTWEVDPFAFPWKVRCPHCKELFPKNDFEGFHQSGYDEHGVFRPELADRALLFNTEHPDPNDPLHRFGVDDANGYEADGHRWRFIGWYAIFGQWKKWVHAGIVNLSSAYAVTGEPRYAFKAAIMLDRVADLFPSFDFHTQGGLVYETTQNTRGQISTWHDACEEVRQLAFAYDRIFDGAKSQEAALTAYLSAKATAYRLENPKTSWLDIQRNIETGIFEDTLGHRERIESNYPRTDIAMLVIETVLRWPGNKDDVLARLDAIVDKATAVDGVSGEKGMAGYTTIAPHALAEILSQMARVDPAFLNTVFERHPALRDTFQFHVDMWCMEQWYPRTGDTGVFGQKNETYEGVPFSANPGVEPSMYSFLIDVSAITNNPDLVQVLYLANGAKVDGLPHDLFAENPESFQAAVRAVIDREGPAPKLGSIDKKNWHLAILRSGEGANRRALWLDYDAGERHGHLDGMNVGLFAKGLDLIPDFGYPPVGYGGWEAPRARWYTMTAAHATVVVDGKNQSGGGGQTTLWADGELFRALRASAPALIGGEQYERTLAMVDLDERDSYVFDVFRVKGGQDHAKFFHSSFGEATPQGLNLADAPAYRQDTQMRAFREDAHPSPGWHVDWKLSDPYGYVPADQDLHVRYTDLTTDARAYLCEAWVDVGLYGAESRWIPRVVVRRTGDAAPLASTFVSIIEPYETASRLKSVQRVPLETSDTSVPPDSLAGVVLERTDGRRDVLVAADGLDPIEIVEPKNGIHLKGELALVTLGPQGPEYLALCNTEAVRTGDWAIALKPGVEFVELGLRDDAVDVLAGSADAVLSAKRGERDVRVHD